MTGKIESQHISNSELKAAPCEISTKITLFPKVLCIFKWKLKLHFHSNSIKNKGPARKQMFGSKLGYELELFLLH